MNHDYEQCHACGAPVEERRVEHSVGSGDDWMLIRDVPTGVCTRCGEQILRWDVAERLEEIVGGRSVAEPSGRIEVPVFAY